MSSKYLKWPNHMYADEHESAIMLAFVLSSLGHSSDYVISTVKNRHIDVPGIEEVVKYALQMKAEEYKQPAPTPKIPPKVDEGMFIVMHYVESLTTDLPQLVGPANAKQAPKVHTTYESAATEAERLARLESNKRYIVLKMISRHSAEITVKRTSL